MVLISDNAVTSIGGMKYIVEKWGSNGMVLEERLIPIPTVIPRIVYNLDGSVNEDLSTKTYTQEVEQDG